MTNALIQLTLAIAPALMVAGIIKHVQLPWEAKKLPSERAEILSLLARDVRSVKTIMAHSLARVNVGASCNVPRLPLTNWKRLKNDPRLKKYSDEKIFMEMISQFKRWEHGSRIS